MEERTRERKKNEKTESDSPIAEEANEGVNCAVSEMAKQDWIYMKKRTEPSALLSFEPIAHKYFNNVYQPHPGPPPPFLFFFSENKI